MQYYQILKQRRLDLNLSIQDISTQTRLRPEYIRAIEEHNLDIFSDDFSYVRYFIHGYCDAIGVNWEYIKDAVDADVMAYASARDQALQQAQVKMIQSMPSAKPSKQASRASKKRRNQTNMKSSASKLSRYMSWGNQNKLSRLILVSAVCLITLFAIIGYVSRSRANTSLEAERLAREQELKNQEETTQRLAEDLQNRKRGESANNQQGALGLTALGNSRYRLSGFLPTTTTVPIVITPNGQQSVTIYWNDNPAYSATSDQLISYDLKAEGDGVLQVTISGSTKTPAMSIGGYMIPENCLTINSTGMLTIQFEVVHDGIPATQGESQSVSQEQPTSEYESQYEEPVEEPVNDPSYYEDPSYVDPTYQDPAYTDPTYEEPLYEEPIYGGSDGLTTDGQDYYPIDANGNPILPEAGY